MQLPQKNTNWVMPSELKQPIPRQIKIRPFFIIMAVVIPLAFFVPFLFALALDAKDAYKMQTLKTQGVSIDGTVTNLYTSLSHGRSRSTLYHVDYRFILPNMKDSQAPNYQNSDTVSKSDYAAIRTGQTIPVIYDPNDPEKSALNINDKIHKNDPFKFLYLISLYLIPIPTILASILIFISFSIYRKEKQLLMWGRAVAATIINEEEYNGGKAGRQTAITYKFEDAQGTIIEGNRKGLPIKSDKRKNFQAFYLAVTQNPTVLFNPDNSKRNLLYPLTSVFCTDTRKDAEIGFIR